MKDDVKTVNYIDNAKFLNTFLKYIEARELNKKEGKEPPRIPNEIGNAFMQIATRLGSKHNFNGYTFLDEMISDGILNAVQAVDSFDPEKGTNPFAYFTQIIFWAFLRRIEKEKKEREGRNDMMLGDYDESFTLQDNGDSFTVDKSELFMFYQD